MNPYLSVLEQPWSMRLGWSLIHLLWQGVILLVILEIALAAVGRKRADLRYSLCCLAMFALPLCFLLTFSNSSSPTPTPAVASASAAIIGKAGDATLPVPTGGIHVRTSVQFLSESFSFSTWTLKLEDQMPLILTGWGLGLLFLTLRKLGGFLLLGKLRSRAHSRPDADFSALFVQACVRMGVKAERVTLILSTLIEVPMTIGWRNPVVIFPLSLLSGLSCLEVQLLLEHELAHIRRHDYLINLIQTAIETIFFYHPVTWWISHRIRQERENCCDDLVVAGSNEPLTYAKVLYQLERTRIPCAALASAANGGSLLQRVQRLLVAPKPTGLGLPLMLGTLSLLILITPLSGSLGTQVAATPQADLSPAQAKAQDIVAMVNQQPIFRIEVTSLLYTPNAAHDKLAQKILRTSLMRSDIPSRGLDVPVSFEKLRDYLIDFEVMAQSVVKDRQICIQHEIDPHIKKIIQTEYRGDETLFRKDLQASGMTWRTYENTLFRQYKSWEFWKTYGIGPAREYFQGEIKELPQTGWTHYTYVWFWGQYPESSLEKNPGYLQAKAALEKIRQGADFMDLVRQATQTGQDENVGTVSNWTTTGGFGWIAKDCFAEDFSRAEMTTIEKLPPGQVSEVMRDENGDFCLVRVSQRLPAQVKDSDQTRAEIDELVRNKENEFLKAALDPLKAKARIQVFN